MEPGGSDEPFGGAGADRPPPALTLLDGATGTELAQRGVDTRGPLFGADFLAAHPAAGSAAAEAASRGRAALLDIHRAYLEAGAQVITAFTFRTNARALGRAGLDPQESANVTRAAVEVAREACRSSANAAASAAGVGAVRSRARVAGSIAPVEDCYRPTLSPPYAEALREHLPFARALRDAGCDLLLVETVCARAEGLAAVEAAVRTGLPVWVSTMTAPFRSSDPAEPARMLDGTPLTGFFAAAREAGAQAALLNCLPCDAVDRALPTLAEAGFPAFGAYAHQGEVDPMVAWPAPPVLSPSEYRQRAAAWIAQGASIVGGCCGTTPAHIAALHRLFQGARPGRAR